MKSKDGCDSRLQHQHRADIMRETRLPAHNGLPAPDGPATSPRKQDGNLICQPSFHRAKIQPFDDSNYPTKTVQACTRLGCTATLRFPYGSGRQRLCTRPRSCCGSTCAGHRLTRPSQLHRNPGPLLFHGFARAVMVLVSQTDAGAIMTVPDLLNALVVPDEVWAAFVHVAGDPGKDIRLVAAMPHWVIPQIVGSAVLPSGDRLTPIQAAQVGLVWRNARWVIHLRGGGDASRFVDNDPWTMPSSGGPPDGSGHGETTTTSRPTARGSSSRSKENLLKMANLVDQTDESETRLPDALKLNEWTQRYIVVMGAPPQEEEGPTDAQLAALHRRVAVQKQQPYVDFSRVLKNQKSRAFMPIGDGSFVMKELPGPQNLSPV